MPVLVVPKCFLCNCDVFHYKSVLGLKELQFLEIDVIENDFYWFGAIL